MSKRNDGLNGVVPKYDYFEIESSRKLRWQVKDHRHIPYICRRCKEDVDLRMNEFLLVPFLSINAYPGLLRMEVFCGGCGSEVQKALKAFMESGRKPIPAKEGRT